MAKHKKKKQEVPEKVESTQPLVSIVIPTLNNTGMLTQTILSVEETCKNLNHEIIVACDDCTSQTAAYVKDMKWKMVALEGNKGFATACNAGAKLAEGEFLVFLNDDTLPAKEWLHRLLYAHENLIKKMGIDSQVGALGPMSNHVAGIQALPQNKVYTPQNRDAVSDQLPEQYGITHFISGFCFFISKTLFDEVGGFDEQFFNGAEDNALCNMLLQRGYHLGVVGNSYVYHYGSSTLNQPKFKDLRNGVANVPEYYRQYSLKGSDTEQKLTVIYRVKIRSKWDEDVFMRSLEKSGQVADHICVLDDGSPIDLTLRDGEDIQGATLHYRRHDRDFNEIRDRNELLQMGIETGATWLLALDHDEILEEKATREYMDKLMRTPIPHVFGFYLQEYTLWNSEDYVRHDGVWGVMQSYRMWRVQPQRKLVLGSDKGFHCEHVPVIPGGSALPTSLRIKHYGYIRPEERQRKYLWYEKTDKQKDPKLIGAKDYFHIVDESDLLLRPWQEHTSVGLATMMKDELFNCIEFLVFLPFFDDVVIVDTGSTDGSDEFMKWAGHRVFNHTLRDNFSNTRNFAVRKLTTHWCFQLDLDERMDDLLKFRRALDYPAAMGFMFTIKNFTKDGRYAISETIRLFRKGPGIQYKNIIHETVDDVFREKQLRTFRGPVTIIHLGYLRTDEELKQKMKFYLRLNERMRRENPDDARPYYNIALHLMEVPQLTAQVVEYLEKAIQLDPRFHAPRKELGLLHIRLAGEQIRNVLKILPPSHPERVALQEVNQAIGRWSEFKPGTPQHVLEAIKEGVFSDGIGAVRGRTPELRRQRNEGKNKVDGGSPVSPDAPERVISGSRPPPITPVGSSVRKS